jgi:hypothetical protein
MPTDLTADSTADPTAVSTAVVLDSHHAADLADLLRCLHTLIDAEHDQLNPLLAKHDYDLTGLRTALDHYAALLHTTDHQPPF